MRRVEKEVNDPAWCRSLLGAVPYLVLALNDAGAPYAVPLCIAVAEGVYYLHMAAEGRKVELLRADPRVGFIAVAHAEVTPAPTACATGMRADSVAGTALCTVIDDPGERRTALDAFAHKYTGHSPVGYENAALEATLVVRLDVVSITGRRTG